MSATIAAGTNQKAPTLPPEIAELAQRGWRLFPLCRPDDLSFEERDRGKAPARGFV
jgi:hypothetical protein